MNKIKQSAGLRIFILGFLTLILLIPSVLIQELISERENRRDSVSLEVSEKWGTAQTITGPVLSIPYRYRTEQDGIISTSTRYAHFLPKNLEIEGNIEPEIRYRGIFETIVYTTNLSISGHFSPLSFNGLSVPAEDFMIGQAILSIGITDMTGIRQTIPIEWDGRQYTANPGIATNDVLASGVSISPNLQDARDHYFNIDIHLNGSSELLFSPVGEESTVGLTSGWPNPSFTGNFLPEQREVSSSGFSAGWSVLHLNRNYPQQWLGPNYEVSASSFGVKLLPSVDPYQKVMRTAKYAILFISLTFLTFFLFELFSKKAIHPVQYLLVGTALLIFYTLLLSLSEYITFGLAYTVSSAAIISLITFYAHKVLSDSRRTGILLGVLILLYGYLYILLQLQDYALLLGSIGLFTVLAAVMYLTRNIDWFEVMESQSEPDSSMNNL
ncbi:MAG: cell envelope integrity protein CreD [Balneolaceae bacterium]|nr:cell envelope integrity protein CreD [Balneolaceae bacterium]